MATMMGRRAALVAFCMASLLGVARADEPLTLAKTGWLYAGGHLAKADGKEYMTGQIYAEYMIPAQQTHATPIIMVHGGTMSGTNYTGTPDGREGWAQYFVRRGYAVYTVDQVGRGRSPYNPAFYGPAEQTDAANNQARYTAEERFNRWPQARLHTQWPGDGTMDDPAVRQLVSSQLPAIKDFHEQMELNRDALVALIDRIGPSILMVHSQAGAFGWPVVDARPDGVRALVAVEPNGPPYRGVDFVGAPEWFKQQGVTLPWGITGVPLTYEPAVKDASELRFVQEEAPQGDGLVRCFRQAEPARKLGKLTRTPILVLSAEASYHAPYDHCTVQYLQQAGLAPTWIKLADRGIRGNSHMMMVEKNNRESAEVIAGWLADAVRDETAH